jgi:subtilisin family serine protease
MKHPLPFFAATCLTLAAAVLHAEVDRSKPAARATASRLGRVVERTPSPPRPGAIAAAEKRSLAVKLAQPLRSQVLGTRIRGQSTLRIPGGGKLSAARPAIFDGMVRIEALAATDGQQLLAELQAAGLQHGRVRGRFVEGLLPLSAVGQSLQMKSLNQMRPSLAMAHAGVTTSQGDIAQRSDVARATFGVSGAGVKVGILSDSFNALEGMETGQANGDLPADITILSDVSSGADEGRAMGEIVHDVAPGASLAFHTAWLGQIDFAMGILSLVLEGCQVITDDVLYFYEPMFTDGIIAQAVDLATSFGASYFSAAGNEARQAFEDTYRVSPTRPGWGEGPPGTAWQNSHDFDPAADTVDNLLDIRLYEGVTYIALQWAQPYLSAHPDSPGATGDVDLFLNYADGEWTGIASWNTNVGYDPAELIGVLLTFPEDTPAELRYADLTLSIDYWEGEVPNQMKLVWFGNLEVREHLDRANKGSIYGHANARGANAVGAARYYRTPAYGVNPPWLEMFSSAGPTAIYLEPDGTPLAEPEVRPKPDLCAPNGGNTTFFFFDFPEGDGFPNFFGTSASAPHAAGVAALMLEANPALTPDELAAALKATALDMLAPGFDFDSGYGLIQADLAVEAVGGQPVLELPWGDLDQDGCVGLADLELLRAAVRAGSSEARYDINQDGRVSAADLRSLVGRFTHPGGACP